MLLTRLGARRATGHMGLKSRGSRTDNAVSAVQICLHNRMCYTNVSVMERERNAG
jgi:hypothetical protein